MMNNKLNAAVETSIFCGIYTIFLNGYRFFRKRIFSLSKDSRILNYLFSARRNIAAAFRYSFFYRITDTDIGKPPALYNILSYSRFLQYCLGSCGSLKTRFASRLKASSTVGLIKNIRMSLYALPLKEAGIVVVIATFINIALFLILKRNISAWGWFMRVLLLLLGLAGILCRVDWPTLKENSRLLK